ncbi:TPA: chromosome partitioning protein ParB [Klebsiella pneumoniae subsp. pneumoniae]|nr:chromosome partitioning protein ParB [Klebsiella pneumoniae subsp. pneumoniae]
MANSFKQMIKSGQIKRPDSGMFISIDDIHVKPGFNKREDDERTRLADDDLFHFLMNGGVVPPLEVSIRDEGGVWIVEGHRRQRCYMRCREAGKPVDRLHIVPFVGNDVDRVKEHGENAGKVLEKDKATAAAAGKKKVTRSLIAPEISVKKARRLVELITLAGVDPNGTISLEGFALAEVLQIVEEQKAIAADRG